MWPCKKKQKKKLASLKLLRNQLKKKRTRNRKVLPVKTQLSDDRFPRVKANWIFRKCMGLSGSEVCTYICQQQQQQQKSLFFFPFKVCDLLPTAPSHLESSCLLNFFLSRRRPCMQAGPVHWLPFHPEDGVLCRERKRWVSRWAESDVGSVGERLADGWKLNTGLWSCHAAGVCMSAWGHRPGV